MVKDSLSLEICRNEPSGSWNQKSWALSIPKEVCDFQRVWRGVHKEEARKVEESRKKGRKEKLEKARKNLERAQKAQIAQHPQAKEVARKVQIQADIWTEVWQNRSLFEDVH